MDKTKLNNFIVNYYKNDTVIGNKIRTGTLHGIENILFFKKYYRPKSNILDIGGFIGSVSLVLSKIIDKNQKIYVFEPQYYDCLIKNINDNNLKNVIMPYKCGLANTNGYILNKKKNINHKGNYGGKCLAALYNKSLESLFVDNGDNDENSDNTIELKKLDTFGLKNIGLIKIDVEGFELLVLNGGIKTIKDNNYPPIFIEIWSAKGWRNTDETRDYYIENKKKIIIFLLTLNYKLVHKNGMDYIFIHNKKSR